jgi:MFS family permease
VFSKEKTKWLNILHAGWPGGMVFGGLLILLLIPDLGWKWKVALLIIPAAIYGFMLLKAQFPVQERVKAGVPYKEMLQEAGVIGAAIVVLIILAEFGRVFGWTPTTWLIISAVLIIAYGLYVRSLGRILFIFLVLIMIPLATTELGTDSWITDLMKSIMGETSKAAGYIIVYTAFIMMVLRFLAGPIVERLKPLGLLAVSSLIAIIGLVFLSKAAGFAIFIAATIYALGKTFFWPTMLGVVSERFPKGGALTINAISGVGMLCVGIIGATFLGNIQDKEIDKTLSAANPALHSQVVAVEKMSIFGKYQPLDVEKVAALAKEDQTKISDVTKLAKQDALMTVAIFPTIMLICYLILILYFRAKGGYKPVELEVQKK